MDTHISKLKKGYRCRFTDIDVRTYASVIRIMRVIKKELKKKKSV